MSLLFLEACWEALYYYGVAIAISAICAMSAIRIRRFWLVVVLHGILSCYVIHDESTSRVLDRDIIFLLGFASRLLLANVYLFMSYTIGTLAIRRLYPPAFTAGVSDAGTRGK